MKGNPLGAIALSENRCQFCVWAPQAEKVELYLPTQNRICILNREETGYYLGILDGIVPGDLYYYRLNGNKDVPDPASRSQPLGVHGPSQVIGSIFPWTDRFWTGISLSSYIIYELHVGAFTWEGTFQAVIQHLESLKALGITAIELMPIVEFPGPWNWGYDGAALFAASSIYGGPSGLCQLVDACHVHELAVILDVVYNHAAPEGCYLGEFGPYFSKRYQTPWGAAFNFDGAYSDHVRNYFVQNALYWLRDCHIDALRLDAVDAILDMSAWPFLEELAETVEKEASRYDRHWLLFAEDNSNNSRFTLPREKGGIGLDARWAGDFHHAIHTYLGSDQTISRIDFGSFSQVIKAVENGLVYTGEYSARYNRPRGTPNKRISADQIVVFSQNHDQVANTETGKRSSQILSFEQCKLLASLTILSPYIPLLFMGEEYGEKAPFYFFARYSSVEFTNSVAVGRRKERNLASDVPDSSEEEAFLRSHLDHSLINQGEHSLLHIFYKELIHIRKTIPALGCLDRTCMVVVGDESRKILTCQRTYRDNTVFTVFNLSKEVAEFTFPRGQWHKHIASGDARWCINVHNNGLDIVSQFEVDSEMRVSLPPMSMALFEKR